MTGDDRLTEERIFEAATAVFEEKGLDGARMQDIADRAGINKALLHYYFRSKEKLFNAVFDNLADIVFAKFSGIFEQDMPFEEKIRHFFVEHMSFLQQYPRIPIFILNEVSKDSDLVNKFIKKINIGDIKEKISKDMNNMMPPDLVPHLMISIVSLSIFPVVARPILEKILESAGHDYKLFIEERKHIVPELILSAAGQFRNKTDNNTD